METVARLRAALARYTDHPDPAVALGNTVAAIVLGNQPFYPLYLYALIGPAGLIGFCTWVTTPLFALSPIVARTHPTRGRILLCAAATANTVLCLKLLGQPSGVGLFGLPTLMLVGVIFHAHEWRIAALLGAASAAALLAAYMLVGQPLLRADLGPALFKLHVISVGSLLFVMSLLTLRKLRRRTPSTLR